MTLEQQTFVNWQQRWFDTARSNQIVPDTDDVSWTQCGFLAGRGFGKTRVGAESRGSLSFSAPM